MYGLDWRESVAYMMSFKGLLDFIMFDGRPTTEGQMVELRRGGVPRCERAGNNLRNTGREAWIEYI